MTRILVGLFAVGVLAGMSSMEQVGLALVILGGLATFGLVVLVALAAARDYLDRVPEYPAEASRLDRLSAHDARNLRADQVADVNAALTWREARR